MRKYYRALKLFLGIACRIYGTGKFRPWPYKYEELLVWGTMHEDYKGKHTPEDFIWISPALAWDIVCGVCFH